MYAPNTTTALTGFSTVCATEATTTTTTTITIAAIRAIIKLYDTSALLDLHNTIKTSVLCLIGRIADSHPSGRGATVIWIQG